MKVGRPETNRTRVAVVAVMCVSALAMASCASSSASSQSTTTTKTTILKSGQSISTTGAVGVRYSKTGNSESFLVGPGFTFKINGVASDATLNLPSTRVEAGTGQRLIFVRYSLGQTPGYSGTGGSGSPASPDAVLIIGGARFPVPSGLTFGGEQGMVFAAPKNSQPSLELDSSGLNQTISLVSLTRGTEVPAILYRPGSQSTTDPNTGLPALVQQGSFQFTVPFSTSTQPNLAGSTGRNGLSWSLGFQRAELAWALGGGSGGLGITAQDPKSALLIINVGELSTSNSLGWQPPSAAQMTLTLPGQAPMQATTVSDFNTNGMASTIDPNEVYWVVPASMTTGQISISVASGASPSSSGSVMVGTPPAPVTVSFG